VRVDAAQAGAGEIRHRGGSTTGDVLDANRHIWCCQPLLASVDRGRG
jgi:pyridoxal biosynthesis lyase PdxS